MNSPESIATLIRALGLAAALFATGVGIARFWEPDRSHAASASGRLATLGCLAPLLALVPVLAFPLAQGAVLGGQWDGFLAPRMQSLAWFSPQGAEALACSVGLGLQALGCLRIAPIARAGGWIVGAGALLVFTSTALAGHVLDGPMVLRPALVVHVGIAAFWIGGVVRLLALCRPDIDVRALGRSGESFSRVASAVVPALPLLGLMLAAGVLPDWNTALHGSYGRLLGIKLTIYVLLLGLAAFNRWMAVPRALRGEDAARASLRASLMAELALLGLALACTALLGSGLIEHPGM